MAQPRSTPADSEYVRSGYWTPELTIDFWRRNAARRPNALAVADDRVAYTWAGGMQAVAALGGGLMDAGVQRDAVLLVQAPNSALLVLFRLACEYAGVLPAFLHQGFRRSEIEVVAGKVRPVGAVIAAQGGQELPSLYRELRGALGLRHLYTVEPGTAGLPSLADLAGAAAPESGERRARPYEPTGIVTSSGTTGLPKCVGHAASARLASARVYVERLAMREGDRVLTCIPFYTGGGDMQFHATPQAAAALVVQPRFTPEGACELIEREGASGAVMVPTMLARIAALPNLGSWRLSTLRWVVCGGAMLPYEIGARFEDATGAKIVQGYGLMDYGALTSHCVDDPREARLRSYGRVMPGNDLVIVDGDGRGVPPGSVGEICVRGPHCSGSYMGDPEGTRIAWQGGYFHTGDLGRMTEDGYLVLEGRSKDIIIRGGQNISAAEVEAILCRHPAIHDAAVVRMPDAELGERACAFVIPRAGRALDFDAMVSFMKSQEVASFKIPERLEIASGFPMTAAGNKVDKRALEALLRAPPDRHVEEPGC